MSLALFLAALIGHGFVWVAAVNRLHSSALAKPVRDVLTWTAFAVLAFAPPALGLWYFTAGRWLPRPRSGAAMDWLGAIYLGLCWAAAVAAVSLWARRHLFHRPPSVLRYHRPRVVELPRRSPAEAEKDGEHHFLVRIPGNEILALDVSERAFELPRLPAALDRLSIMHLSDFHFTGRVARSYFESVVRTANDFQPELTLITGDLVDRSQYIDWIPDTLGRLEARYGVYYVLGNHDLRVDTPRLRRVLCDCGLVDLGGRWCEALVRGQRIVLAGNELPWIPPAADLSHAPPGRAEGGPLRIALCHSPDQFAWARANDVDLVLAGHTHGGQIRLPLLGAIFSPTRTGVRYASGTFHHSPTTMHVTRGVSGELPLRLNCPPEMSHVILHSPPRDEPRV